MASCRARPPWPSCFQQPNDRLPNRYSPVQGWREVRPAVMAPVSRRGQCGEGLERRARRGRTPGSRG